MGLTRIRAEQISDIDYKQAVRVVQTTNITLAGEAPAEVDGVSLVAGDRVLVTGQSTASQNGLYQVQTVGAGSNGTWVRTSDANQDGEIEAGMIVMATEGVTYADTQWKLTTNDPIVIGTTALTFVLNAVSVIGGENTQVQYNSGGVLAGSPNLTFDGANLFVGGYANVIGNVIGAYIIGNGSQLTGITTSSIANGTSNVDIATANGNVTATVDGNTTFTVTSTGANITGYVDATGTITTSGNLDSANVNATAGITAGTTVTATGNVSGGNITTSGVIDATGNVSGGNITTVGDVAGANVNASAGVTAGTTVTATGNVSGGNLVTAGVASVASIVKTGSNGVGNIGQVDNSFDTVFAKATSAQYADVAERYLADAAYPVGTVLVFGGDREVTQSQIDHGTAIAGTVSDKPAYVMNSGLEGDHVVTVALLGRVPVRVIGTIRPGDLLVASELPGVATCLVPENYAPGCVIGKALESYDSQREGRIEAVVGRV